MLKADEYGTILLHKAWNADVTSFSNLCKSGMTVAENDEFLQTSCLLTDVDKFIFGIILIQLLDLCAVRTAFHYVYLSHNYIALCVFNSFLILAYALFSLYNTFSLIRLGNRCSAITSRTVCMVVLISCNKSHSHPKIDF